MEGLLPPDLTDAFLQAFEPARYEYRARPSDWVRDVCAEEPWSKQDDVLRSLVEHRYTAAQACHDVGKSFIASRAIRWFVDSHPFDEVFVVWTAPRWSQVNAIIGRELRSLQKRAGLPGRVTLSCDFYLDGDVLVGYGRKPADTDAHGFQGIHARYILVVVDEACGVPKALWDAVDALATNENARVLAIGNPDDPETQFREITKPGSGWNVVKISAFESPNFTKERVAPFPKLAAYMEEHGIPYATEPVSDRLRELLVSPTWVNERMERWGVGSNLFVSKVLGEFPETSTDALITPAMVEQAIQRELVGKEAGRYAFDIARYGTDETVGYRNRGGVVRAVYSSRKQDTMETVGGIRACLDQHPKEQPVGAWIDVVGLGAGVYDRLRELGYKVWEFNAGEAARDPKRFVNRRAEVFWTAREMFLNGLIDLDPDDDELHSQLQSIKYRISSDRRISIESKDDMKKRGMPSPDRADAFVMSLVAEPALFRLPTIPAGQPGKMTGDHLGGDLLNRPL